MPGDIGGVDEAGLRRSEARYRSLVEATAMDVWRADADGRLVTDMPRWRAFTGQRIEDLFADGWADAIHPEDRDRAVATWARAAGNRVEYDCEYRIVSADGERARIVHARAVPIVEDGALVEWIGTTVDVTDRRISEDERDEARRRLAFVAAASAALARSLEVDSTLEAIGRLVVPEVADWCTVHLTEEDGGVRAALVRHRDPELERRLRELSAVPAEPDSPYGAHAVIRTGRPQLFPEISDELIEAATSRAEARAVLRELSPRTGMTVPLVARDETIGALTVARREGGPYTENELGLIGEIAQRAALSLANARLYARERGVALTLQRSLLPERLPAVPGVETTFRYAPGTADTEVGGDWLDVIPLSTGRAALVIGDVMGRGVRAAAVMGQMRTAIRAYALLDLPPAELLSHLDELVRSMDTEMVTCVYAVYDPATAKVCVSNAGHPPPVLVHDGRTLLMTCGASVPLGVGGVAFEQAEADLPPGATLVLYTDGLVEAPDQDVDAGIEALRASVVRAAGGPLDALGDRLLTDLGRVVAHDDIALLAVRVRPDAGPRAAVRRLPAAVESVREARRFVAEVAAEHGLGGVAEAAALLVGELVTNAVRHAGSELELRVRGADGTLYAEVADDDRRVPRPKTAGELEEAGRGLVLVAAMATRWGVRPLVDGKVVWFQLDAAAS